MSSGHITLIGSQDQVFHADAVRADGGGSIRSRTATSRFASA